MVLYNRYKFRQQKKQRKKKSLDHPVADETDDAYYSKHSIDYIKDLKAQIEARHAKATNLAMRRKLLEGVMKSGYELEMNRLRSEMHNPRIPETSIEHLRNRYDALAQLSESIY